MIDKDIESLKRTNGELMENLLIVRIRKEKMIEFEKHISNKLRDLVDNRETNALQ